MPCYALSDEQHQRLAPLLPGKPSDCGVTARDNRLFLDAVLFVANNGGQWRDLPERFGKWNSVYRALQPLEQEGCLEAASRSHPRPGPRVAHAGLYRDPGSPRRYSGSKKGGQCVAFGRSRGGLSTKLHVVCDGLGQPVRFRLTAGQAGDAPVALGLLGSLRCAALLADKAYDADDVREWAADQEATAVIPPHRSRSQKPAFDREWYRERNQMERLIGRLKRLRRVATRYDQTDRNYLGFVQVAAVAMLLL